MEKLKHKKYYIITIVIAIVYSFIFSRVLFPRVPDYYRMSYIDNKVDTYGTENMYNYTLGNKIDLNFLKKNICSLSKGWSFIEDDGIWSNGKKSQICFYFNKNIKKDTVFKLKIQYLANGVPNQFKVNVNDGNNEIVRFNENNEASFAIKKDTLKKGFNFINFYWDKTYRPGLIGENNDGRELCVKLVSFMIIEK